METGMRGVQQLFNERETERTRKRETEREKGSERKTDKDRDRETQRQRQRERETGTTFKSITPHTCDHDFLPSLRSSISQRFPNLSK
jgi:hypothetical protein